MVQASPHETEPVKLLLVDDVPANLIALKAVLTRPDYDLITATSGEDALKLLLHHEFAAVLLDVMMPDMDGFAVASEMKKIERTRYIPIIFVTAIARDLKDMFKGYAVGGVDYIQKPLEPEVVRAKVSVFVALFRQRKQIQRQSDLIRASERAQSLERETQARLRAEAAEKRYYDLINWVDHAVLWEYSPGIHNFSFVSLRSLEILGYSPEHWIRDPDFFINHIPESDREPFSRMLQDAVTQGRDGRCEHRFQRADGEMLWVHSGVNPRKDSQGRVNLLWGLTLDITDFKTSELNQRFLAEASAMLSSSLDIGSIAPKIAHLIVPAFADWCAIDIAPTSKTGVQRVGLAHAPAKSDHWARALDETAALALNPNAIIASAMASNEPIVWRSLADPPPPDAPPLAERVEPLRELGVESLMILPLGSGSRRSGCLTLLSTESHRHFRNRDLNFFQELAWHIGLAVENARLYEEARLAVRLRDEVLGVVSHDLRGPLTAISMNAQLLEKRKAVDPQAVGGRIRRTVDRMKHLVSDLLDLTRIEGGGLPLELRSQPAQDLVNEALDLAAPIAAAKSIAIQRELPPEPVLIQCDRERTLQVLGNLISNAIKFTPESGQITVGVWPRRQEVEVWVADTGPGVPEQERTRIFERFWQAPEERRSGQGAGLGLYISKKMVEAQHGSIGMKPRKEGGSRFSFTLPKAA